MKRTLIACCLSLSALFGTGHGLAQVQPFEQQDYSTPATTIDQIVFLQQVELGIRPAFPCSDVVFLRRVHLDVIGTLPTLQEARRFLNDRSPGKRARLIDELLEREEFAEYWSMKWCDLLRVKAEFPINLWPNAVQAYHRWVHSSLKSNKPYDRFARELLTSSGSCFREPTVNFYRGVHSKEPEALASAVALTFMGARAQGWPGERLADMSVFFSRVGFKSTKEWKEEIVFFDASSGIDGQPPDAPYDAVLPDGTTVTLAPDQDPRLVLADWLIRPENPWFTRCIVNRVWCWLQGRAIVHPVDDLRDDSQPSNPALLEYLERELVEADYDLKHLYRLILNSRVYQLSAIPRSKSRDEGYLAQAEAQFAHYNVRRLEAEVLIDVICRVTGSHEAYTSNIPEPFTFIPEDQRAISLADGSITSPFLELYGRSSRDTGMDSDRNHEPTAAQRLHLLNSSHVQDKLLRSKKLKKLSRQRRPGILAADLYLTILSRRPTPRELKVVRNYLGVEGIDSRKRAVDLAWALFNSAEFLYRH